MVFDLARVRPLAAAVLLCAAALLAACSVVQLAYRQAPNYVYWRMNKAYDLESHQQDAARAAIREWFEWNRATQLPVYARFLARAQTEALGDITPTLACQRRDEMEAWMRTAIDHGAPLFARLAVLLTPEQIDHLQAHFASSNEDFADDYLSDDPEERREALDKFALRWVEMIYGRLDKAQRQQLSADVARLPVDAAVLYQQQRRFQTRLLALLRELDARHATAAQALPPVRALLMDLIEPADPRQKADLARWIAAGCQMAASVHNRSTEAQRQHAAELFKDWRDDLSVLSLPS